MKLKYLNLIIANEYIRWPAELAGVRLQHFTVSYSPCLDCMRAEWRLPQAVRAGL